ncbi:MAG: pur operon repressor, partial [Firmicutes bacterium]|nr:pur operon repressor [Bacillota bacterium]
MRRSERLVRITQQLLEHPGQPLSLTEMAVQFGAAKSSVSEDLSIVRAALEVSGSGRVRTFTGAGGGVQFDVAVSPASAEGCASALLTRLEQGDRVLPGGYLYMTDVLSDPATLLMVARMFAAHFAEASPDVVLTVETKGIPLAVATAQLLNRPYVVARRDHKWSEGSSVSLNYVSGSLRRIQSMSLARRLIAEGARVLIVDDFMRAGGTVVGMTQLMREFSATVVGIAVFMETGEPSDKMVPDYISLLRLDSCDEATRTVKLSLGNYFTRSHGGKRYG